MINPETGEIHFPGEIETFGPDTTREEFLHSEVGRLSKRAPTKFQELFILPRAEYKGHPFSRSFAFGGVAGERLFQIELASMHPDFPQNWDDWTGEKEMKRKHFHDSLLSELFGGGSGEWYERPWGAITSCYDSKADQASIGITYFW